MGATCVVLTTMARGLALACASLLPRAHFVQDKLGPSYGDFDESYCSSRKLETARWEDAECPS